MNKPRLLRADEIEVRVKKVYPRSIMCLLYKTARVDYDILDETFEHWSCEYAEIKGNLYCGIRVEDEIRWNCGTESREDEEGNHKKGEASDALKRAGVAWGIGRELYTAPPIYVKTSLCNIKDGKCNDVFSVAKIEYDAHRRISALQIANENTGNIVFTFKKGEKQYFDSPPVDKSPTPAQTAELEKANASFAKAFFDRDAAIKEIREIVSLEDIKATCAQKRVGMLDDLEDVTLQAMLNKGRKNASKAAESE